MPAAALWVAGVLALGAGVGAGAVVPGGAAGAAEALGIARDQGAPARSEARDVLAPVMVEEDVAGPGEEAAPSAQDVTPTPEPEPVSETTPEPLPDPYLPDAEGLTPADRAAGLTAAGTPPAASGTLVVVAGQEPAPHPDRRVLTVRVEVEDGLPVDAAVFAQVVMATLNDPRGWGADGSVTFARTDAEADIRVVLASPDQVDAMCAPLRTVGEYSCGRYGHAALNYTRWAVGTRETPTGPDLATYREYLINHEVGHLLGKPHVQCPAEGEVAPVMQQQSVKVAPCVLNGWPFPGVDR